MNSGPEAIDLDPAEVVRDHRSRVYRYLLSMARDPDAAEDLTQETFLRALRRLGALRDRAALVSWLDRVATNVFLDWVRAEGRRLAYTDGQAGEGASPIEEIADPGMRVDRQAEQAQMSECVRGFVDELPEDYRAVILLHDAHGLSSHEIAEILGVSVATAKIRIHRGRARLRTALQQGCEFEPDDRGVTVCNPASPAQPDDGCAPRARRSHAPDLLPRTVSPAG
jgi:RNA polymerase sigma-70 factor (ECF subfamily)